MDRKDMFVGQLVLTGLHEDANVVKVVDTAACDAWGNRMKRGRYIAARKWDVARSDFAEGSARNGYKPAGCYTLEEWAARNRQRRLQQAEVRREAERQDDFYRPVYEELVKFVEGMGLSKNVVYTVTRTVGGKEYITDVSLRNIHRNPGEWREISLLILQEFGVIPDRREFKEA